MLKIGKRQHYIMEARTDPAIHNLPVCVIVNGRLVPFGICRWISSLEYRNEVIHGTLSHTYNQTFPGMLRKMFKLPVNHHSDQILQASYSSSAFGE